MGWSTPSAQGSLGYLRWDASCGVHISCREPWRDAQGQYPEPEVGSHGAQFGSASSSVTQHWVRGSRWSKLQFSYLQKGILGIRHRVVYYLTQPSWHLYEVSTIRLPTLQIRKLRLKASNLHLATQPGLGFEPVLCLAFSPCPQPLRHIPW